MRKGFLGALAVLAAGAGLAVGQSYIPPGAGGPPPGPFVSLTDEQWQGAVNLNLMSVVRLCRAVLPLMQAKQWGRIVIDTSFTVKQPLENLILSNSIRAGVTGLAKTLSNELAKDGIDVPSIPLRTVRRRSSRRGFG